MVEQLTRNEQVVGSSPTISSNDNKAPSQKLGALSVLLVAQIKPDTLRNDYNAIAKLAHEKAEPVYITRNGEGDLLLCGIEAFERREALLVLKKKLLLAKEQRLTGAPTVSLGEPRPRTTGRCPTKMGRSYADCR